MEILIADDSKMIRFLTLEILKSLGYTQVNEASNVAEAKSLLARKKIDLIISDFHMPGETGLEFLRFVRASSNHAKIPFLLMTTEGEKKNIVAAVQAGVNAYLFKPVKKVLLTQKLTEVCAKFELQMPATLASSAVTPEAAAAEAAADAAFAAAAAEDAVLDGTAGSDRSGGANG